MDRVELAEKGAYQRNEIERAVKDYYYSKLQSYNGEKAPVTMAMNDTMRAFSISEITVRRILAL